MCTSKPFTHLPMQTRTTSMTQSTNVGKIIIMTKSPDCINKLTGEFNTSRDIITAELLQYANCLKRGNATIDFFLFSM